MIHIVDMGVNHETAPVELRESLALYSESSEASVACITDLPWIKEGLFISTCNRVEALFTTENTQEAESSVVELLSQTRSVSAEDFLPHLFIHRDKDAVRHLLRVASSLDSMIVGEPQILGQIKDAYSKATRERTTGVILNRLMHRAFHTAKRVRTETGICDAAVSVSYAAVELAKKIFYDLRGKKVLLIGAGEMAELAARNLLSQGVTSVTVANRTFERAVDLARNFQGRPVAFEEIGLQLFEADIVISSTASPGYIITVEQVKKCFRKRRNNPLFFIDIAVPRDVEPQVNDLENAYVYDIDDLRGVVRINKAKRADEAFKAERIVEEEVIKFGKWLKTLAVVPTIVSLKEKGEAIRRAEIKKSIADLGSLSPEQMGVLESLTLSIVEKIFNDPIVFLKGKSERPHATVYLDMARKLFNLEPYDKEEEKHEHSGNDSKSQKAS
ncbi:MAG: glutamyl-tRNA reductase [Deltaproteobacteria bacterium]|nr:glutamyl-tRNA reductase [Deltaproteobacteria bacterium]